MSPLNEVLKLLASNPVAFQSLIDAFDALLLDETARASQLATRALFNPEDRAIACVGVGRCEMLRELIQKMKTQVRQTA